MVRFFDENVAPILNVLKNIVNASNTTAFLLKPLALLEESFVISRGKHHVDGLVNDLMNRALAVHETPIDALIFILASCIVITAILGFISRLAHWCVFRHLPSFVLGFLIVVSLAWSVFLGSFRFQALLLIALVSGGVGVGRGYGTNEEGFVSKFNNDGLIIVRRRRGRRALFGFLCASHFWGRFAISRVAVQSLLAMGIVQLIIFVAPPQRLVLTVLQLEHQNVDEMKTTREARLLAETIHGEVGDVSLFSSFSLPNGDNRLFTSRGGAHLYSGSLERERDSVEERAVALLTTNHANGRWHLGGDHFDQMLPRRRRRSLATETSEGSLFSRDSLPYHYRHVVSYFDSSTLSGESTPHHAGGDADAVWIFGKNSHLKNLTVGHRFLCKDDQRDSDGQSKGEQSNEMCWTINRNVRHCRLGYQKKNASSADTSAVAADCECDEGSEGPLKGEKEECSHPTPKSTTTTSEHTSRRGGLEPILIVRSDTLLNNVAVECGAFLEENNRYDLDEGKETSRADRERVLPSSPCVLTEIDQGSDEAITNRNKILEGGLTILVRQTPMGLEEAARVGLIRSVPYEFALSNRSDVIERNHILHSEENDGRRYIDGSISLDATPLNEYGFYKCLVKRHEPFWHVFVRKWPLTAFLLKRSAEMALAGAVEAWYVAVVPTMSATALVAYEIGRVGGAAICGAIEGARFSSPSLLPLCPATSTTSISNNAANINERSARVEDSSNTELDGSIVILPQAVAYATYTTPAFAYSSQTVTAAILSPSASYESVRDALLQLIYETCAASTSALVWSGSPMVWRFFMDIAVFEWRCSVLLFDLTIMPFINAFVVAAQFGYTVIVAAMSAEVAGKVVRYSSSSSLSIAEALGAGLQSSSLFLWRLVSDWIWPAIVTAVLGLMRAAAVAVNAYAETSFKVQLFVAMLQTALVVYNLHLQAVGYAPTAGSPAMPLPLTSRVNARERGLAVSAGAQQQPIGFLARLRGSFSSPTATVGSGATRRGGHVETANTGSLFARLGTSMGIARLNPALSSSAWFSYPYAVSRIFVRNYRSIVIYGLSHLVAGLMVTGTTFLPFSGSLGLHFLALNVAFPLASSYSLLHFMGKSESKPAMALSMALRILLSVSLQKGLGELVGRIVTELTRLFILTVLIGAAALYVSWRGVPSMGFIGTIITKLGEVAARSNHVPVPDQAAGAPSSNRDSPNAVLSQRQREAEEQGQVVQHGAASIQPNAREERAVNNNTRSATTLMSTALVVSGGESDRRENVPDAEANILRSVALSEEPPTKVMKMKVEARQQPAETEEEVLNPEQQTKATNSRKQTQSKHDKREKGGEREGDHLRDEGNIRSDATATSTGVSKGNDGDVDEGTDSPPDTSPEESAAPTPSGSF